MYPPLFLSFHAFPIRFDGGAAVVINTNLLTVNAVKGKAQVVEEDDEEAELRKLQAEMAM